MEIKDECFYQVTGWMRNQLGLKGTKRDIYAIVFGFSQDGESEFTGSLAYLTEWLDISKPTAIKALQELVEQGFLIKRTEIINGVTFNRYRADLEILQGVKKFNWGSKEILQGGSKEILPNKNNIKNNSLNNSIIILDYLNEKAGTHYKPVENQLKFINARLKDYTIEDLKKVIDKKVKEWKGTDLQVYLRPKTLFNATNFESYINGLEVVKNSKDGIIRHNYTDKQLNNLYDSLDDIKI